MEKEPFIQPKVETEKLMIPESVSKLYEQSGLDFEEEYLNLVRKYNEAGVLELLPETGELGVISVHGEELPMIAVDEFGLLLDSDFSSDGTYETEQTSSHMDDSMFKRNLVRKLDEKFHLLLIKKSDLWMRYEDGKVKSVWSKQIIRSFCKVVSKVYIFDFINFGVKYYPPGDFMDIFDEFEQSKFALSLLDSEKPVIDFPELSVFTKLNIEVLEAILNKTDKLESTQAKIEVYDDLLRNKASFTDDVDWDALEAKLRQMKPK